MKRIFWLFGVMSAACLVWLASADTIELNDGTVLQGTITEEDPISVTIQVEGANGGVTEKRWFLKENTTEIRRDTPEEKAARAMEHAFTAMHKLQLDLTNSFQVEYYDRMLTNVFRKFLADYPDSPHTKEVNDKIAEWEAERALVASGKVKVQGQWLTAEEVAARARREAIQQAYQQGLVFLRQKRAGEAVTQFEFVIEKSDDTALVQQARQLRTDAYQQWVAQLEQQRTLLANRIKNLEKRVTDARNAKAQAEAKLNTSPAGSGGLYRGSDIRARARALGASRDVSSGEVNRLGGNTDQAQYFAAASRAGLELQTAEAQLAAANQEATATEETLARIQPQATALGIAVAASSQTVATQTEAEAPAPTASTASPDTLTSIGQFATNYWVYFLAGAVILVWLISRALGR